MECCCILLPPSAKERAKDSESSPWLNKLKTLDSKVVCMAIMSKAMTSSFLQKLGVAVSSHGGILTGFK